MADVTAAGIVSERSGPPGSCPVVLLHAGVADRRMWDPVWERLTRTHDVLRPDLRGFGDSTGRPSGALDHAADVLDLLAESGVTRCHLVGSSMGAGVAVEIALRRSVLVRSLLLAAPGGELIAESTPQLNAFIEAERAALMAGDPAAAAEVNVRWWVDGPQRGPGEVPAPVRDLVRTMQLRAFELTADWDDVQEAEPDPPLTDRLGEIGCPTLVLTGGKDIDAITVAAQRVLAGIPGARAEHWEQVGHLPSLEAPADFAGLLEDRLGEIG